MPKAARRTPGPNPASSTEPYPSSKPGPSSTEAESIKHEDVLKTEDVPPHHHQPPQRDNPLKENRNPPARHEIGHTEVQPDNSNSNAKQEDEQDDLKENPPKPRSHLDIVLPTRDGSSCHETCPVPIYDNCDEVRAKIRTFLDRKSVIEGAGPTDKHGKTKPYTRNQFIKDIGVNTNSLTQFMKREGEMSGAEIGVYHKAYVFFEKLRIFNNEPKSASRITSEEKNGEKGLPLKDPNIHKGGLWIFCHESQDPNDLLTPEEIAKGYYFPKRPFGRGFGEHGLGRGRGGGRGGGRGSKAGSARGGAGGGISKSRVTKSSK